MSDQIKCPVCGSEAVKYTDCFNDTAFYECPTCGRYQVLLSYSPLLENAHLAPYLFHNRFSCSDCREYRYHTTMDKELCDKYKSDFESGNHSHGLPVHMDAEMIENWYPKTLSERVDRILLRMDSLGKHVGKVVFLESEELLGLLFIDRMEKDSYGNTRKRDPSDYYSEEEFMLECLTSQKLIEFERPNKREMDEDLKRLHAGKFRITPEGYARIDVLQKNASHGSNALVAMKFGDDTKPLREAIRTGIKSAGYNAVFIDEVQHNDFITPELLKYIRDSKFVVVDLTHQNNGAYFEEGYAMGLGKPVIQLCKKDTKLHFDIAQKNTIMWATEEDIPQMLSNRIKATID